MTTSASPGRYAVGSALPLPRRHLRPWDPTPNTGAVVTERGAVHGIDQLRVADASIMPSIPAANTNLPTIVVAERIANWLDTR